jgi:hypothetical protein
MRLVTIWPDASAMPAENRAIPHGPMALYERALPGANSLHKKGEAFDNPCVVGFCPFVESCSHGRSLAPGSNTKNITKR